MAKKRDWDKAGREDRVSRSGSLPFWITDWKQGEPFEPVQPRVDDIFKRSTESPQTPGKKRDMAQTQVPNEKQRTRRITFSFVHSDGGRKTTRRFLREELELFIGKKFPINLTVTLNEIRYTCLALPIDVHAWIRAPATSNTSPEAFFAMVNRLLACTKPVELRITGFRVTLRLEYAGIPSAEKGHDRRKVR
jgi:hypothetical protein